MDFNPLVKWFEKNKRDLPWRKNRTFYRVWISEVMLQQTQVETVIPYYHRFLKSFPTLRDLANSEIDQVLKLWEGLGYYSRARNLHKASQALAKQNVLPKDYDELIQFPGFGPYTTAAVLSLTNNRPYPVVDGNVKRFISRLYSIKDSIDKPSTVNQIQTLLEEHIQSFSPRDFNESLMEIGAKICKPKNPDCENCPMKSQCLAFKSGRQKDLPIRKAKHKIPVKKRSCYILTYKNKLLIEQRSMDEMLGGLWKFPDRATKSDIEFSQSLDVVYHQYSHFKLELQSYLITLIRQPDVQQNQRWVSFKQLNTLAFDKATLKIIDMICEANENIISR